MKKYIISYFLTFLFCMGWAQKEYFYSEGQKISLVPVENKEVVYVSTQEKTIQESKKFLRVGIISDNTRFFIVEKSSVQPKNQVAYPLFTAGNDTVVLLDKLITKVRPEFWTSKIWPYLEQLKATIIDTLAPSIYVIQLSDITTALSTANYLSESGWVFWATPDYISLSTTTTKYYNQYYIANYYNNMSKINPEIDKVWKITKGCSNIRVAVIDVGVEHHTDLRDENGNSRVLSGYSAFSDGPVIDAHGTACAGIIAASHSEEMKGIAPNVKIVPVRIGWASSNFASSSEIAKAIYWAFSPSGGNADVLSNSWGTLSPSDAVIQAIKDAQIYGRGGNVETGKKGLGSIVVFSSGNRRELGITGINVYAKYAIAVGALLKDGTLTSYSQTGPELDFVAFGGSNEGDIVTLDLMGSEGYEKGNYTSSFNGTSAACPQISGIAALILSVNPNLSRDEVEQIMIDNAVDLGTSGRDESYGYGLVNGFEAVLDAVRTVVPLELATGSGTLKRMNSYIGIDFMPAIGCRNLASTVYIADMYTVSINLPDKTSWIWLKGDGVDMASLSNEQTFVSTGKGLAGTYYFYAKKIKSSYQNINTWYPCDPSIGNKFLFRKYPQEVLELSNTVHKAEYSNVSAKQKIVLNPGFTVEKGGFFKATVSNEDFDENFFLDCR